MSAPPLVLSADDQARFRELVRAASGIEVPEAREVELEQALQRSLEASSAPDLDGQPFIRLTSSNLLRSQLDADLIKSNAHPIVKAEVSSPVTACALAAQGVGLAVVDAYSPVVAKSGGFRIVPWKSSGVLTYGFFYPKNTANPFVPAFKKILRQLAIADQPSSWIREAANGRRKRRG